MESVVRVHSYPTLSMQDSSLLLIPHLSVETRLRECASNTGSRVRDASCIASIYHPGSTIALGVGIRGDAARFCVAIA
jgi:hypothetical protein